MADQSYPWAANNEGSTPSPPPHSNCRREPVPPDPRLEDYLDHVCAPLVGVVPYARRMELRTELREHLEALVATHEELGSNWDTAVLMALRQFGPPRELARMWASEWKQGAAPARYQPAWRATQTGLASFGLATALALAVPLLVNDSSAQYLMQMGLLLPMAVLLGGMLPLIAGLVTGLVAPARHALGSFFALSVLILPTVALALCAQNNLSDNPRPSDWGVLLALAQAVLWMPIGCGAAALGGSLQRRLALRPEQWVLQ